MIFGSDIRPAARFRGCDRFSSARQTANARDERLRGATHAFALFGTFVDMAHANPVNPKANPRGLFSLESRERSWLN